MAVAKQKSGGVVVLAAGLCMLLLHLNLVVAQTGVASYYTSPYMPSACYGYDASQFPANGYFAAGGDSNTANIWNNGNNCGRIFTITCEGKGCTGAASVQVTIVDRCPNGCQGGRAFDLSAAAFQAIADPSVGIINITYQ